MVNPLLWAGAGWFSAGPFSEPVIFFNDIRRTDEQKGVFGEVNYALSDTAELTLGARWYDIAVDFEEVQTHPSVTVLEIQTNRDLVLTYLFNMHQVMQMVILTKQKLMVLLVKLLCLGILKKMLCTT